MGKRDPDDKHPLQKLMDNTWLLLFLGVVLPTVSYTFWGWFEVWITPAANLP